ncbi:hypothetical protein J3459_011348 [Metarhizium acridum]|nr:hypothetical protein J3459_011348 [Metarhizium acridum]
MHQPSLQPTYPGYHEQLQTFVSPSQAATRHQSDSLSDPELLVSSSSPSSSPKLCSAITSAASKLTPLDPVSPSKPSSPSSSVPTSPSSRSILPCFLRFDDA